MKEAVDEKTGDGEGRKTGEAAFRTLDRMQSSYSGAPTLWQKGRLSIHGEAENREAEEVHLLGAQGTHYKVKNSWSLSHAQGMKSG